ncbi:12487_t:CDS:2 [Entrophospora sp. SA101]|nr:12487_t:CDS:2 [Entrophospora sp. SA101]
MFLAYRPRGKLRVKKKTRASIKNLYISEKELEGHLDLKGFTNLEKLDCSHNQLAELDLTGLVQLEKINCNDNYLNNFDYLSLNPNKLTYLNISDNNLPSQDLTCFKSLKYLNKLERVFISNTDINNGVNYLPNSIRRISYSTNERPESKVGEIAEQLNISRSGLEGELIIENFPKLERLDCSRNQLTNIKIDNLPRLNHFDAYYNKLSTLVINNCPEISYFDIANNFLSNLDFLDKLNNNKLIRLYMSNNDFLRQDIAIFSKFISLEELRASGNNFYGNLQSLKNLKKLKNLIVADTEVDSGFEYLPDNLSGISSILLKEDPKKDTNGFKLVGWTEPTKLEKINPELNIYDVLSNVFFNVRTGDFEGDIQGLISLIQINKFIIEEKEQEINFLKLRIQELTEIEEELENKLENRLKKKVLEGESISKLSDDTMNEIRNNSNYLQKEKNEKLVTFQQNEENDNSNKKIIELLIKKSKKQLGGDIEKISFFDTWFNDNCAMVISKNDKLTGSNNYKEVTRYFKYIILRSEHPAAEMYNNIYTFDLPSLSQNYKNVARRKITFLSQTNPNDYIKPYDIVKRKIDKFGMTHHYAVYLGNNEEGVPEVVHIYNLEEGKKSGKDLGARIDTWERFLDGKREVEICHPFVPFKRPELIREHIEIAVKAGYGKGEYHLLKDNCEHFATMCVYGLGMSQQAKSKIGKADYLLQAIKESNDFFKQLETRQVKKKSTSDSEGSDTLTNSSWEVVQQLVESPQEEKYDS